MITWNSNVTNRGYHNINRKYLCNESATQTDRIEIKKYFLSSKKLNIQRRKNDDASFREGRYNLGDTRVFLLVRTNILLRLKIYLTFLIMTVTLITQKPLFPNPFMFLPGTAVRDVHSSLFQHNYYL